jgi:DNA/RNA endonuclease YhcR with UshA esterase domain
MPSRLKLSGWILVCGVLWSSLALALPPANIPLYIPIAEARQQAQGTAVTVEGLVTVPSGDFRSSSEDNGFALQDQTGGIWVSLQKDLHLRLGQRVQVTGTLGQSNQKLQIAVDPANVKVMPGKELRVATGHVGAATLGFLITVEGTLTEPVQKDEPYGYKVFIDDGTGKAQVYINATTDIDPWAPWLKPGRTIRVTGFGNQYGTVYEVDPRSRRDIRPVR